MDARLKALTLLIASLIVAFSFEVASAEPAQAQIDSEPRLALVIGNANYKSLSKLKNPTNDARVMADRLREAKFTVEIVTDRSRSEIVSDLDAFAKRVTEAGSRAVSVVFFAGHGLEELGVNYVIPTDAVIGKREDIAREGVNVQDIAAKLAIAKNDANILIIDACRDNPFAKSSIEMRSLGLAPMGAQYGVFIASSTASGDAAMDGEGANSPYTSQLAAAILKPGLKIEDVFKSVRRQVRLVTSDRQIPWESTALGRDFYFVPPRPEPTPVELLYAAAEESGRDALFDLLLEKFPDSEQASLINQRRMAKPPSMMSSAASRYDSSLSSVILDLARKDRSAEKFRLIISLFPDSPSSELAQKELNALNEELALQSVEPTLVGEDLINAIERELARIECMPRRKRAQFDAELVLGLRQSTKLTDEKYYWYKPTMAALRHLRKIDAKCVQDQVRAAYCLDVNGERFCS